MVVEAVAVVAVAVVLVVVVVVVAAVASLAQAFLAQRMDRGRPTVERPRESWHCCPPRRLGGTGNSGTAAWQPVTRASPRPRVLLLLNPAEARVSRTGLLFLTAQEKGAGPLFIEFPEPRETPLFRYLCLALFLLLKETPTHLASEADKPQEAQSKPREVSAHNFLMRAFKNPNRCCPVT